MTASLIRRRARAGERERGEGREQLRGKSLLSSWLGDQKDQAERNSTREAEELTQKVARAPKSMGGMVITQPSKCISDRGCRQCRQRGYSEGESRAYRCRNLYLVLHTIKSSCSGNGETTHHHSHPTPPFSLARGSLAPVKTAQPSLISSHHLIRVTRYSGGSLLTSLISHPTTIDRLGSTLSNHLCHPTTQSWTDPNALANLHTSEYTDFPYRHRLGGKGRTTTDGRMA